MYPAWRIGVTSLALSWLPQVVLAQAVTPKEIQETWVGRPLTVSLTNGRSATLLLKADGAISITGDAANDTGTWRLSDDGYCATWKTIRAGVERCFTVRRMGNGDLRIHNPDGSVSGFIAKLD